MSKQYVQHISGQGNKWEVVPDRSTSHQWNCFSSCHELWLPKSEYQPCEPPERWVDVTEQCMEGAQGIVTVFLKNEYRGLEAARGYRLRKICFRNANPFNELPDSEAGDTQVAFIVEKRED